MPISLQNLFLALAIALLLGTAFHLDAQGETTDTVGTSGSLADAQRAAKEQARRRQKITHICGAAGDYVETEDGTLKCKQRGVLVAAK
jgi:DNA-binding PucR family transcriptional regulator